VGTNDGKDFETLLEALPLGESLVIVTDGFNAAKIRAHRCFGTGIQVREAVPAVELRELYRQAKLVVIPLADTAHGSGHTVLMENMALGKILIVSASRSMRGYLEDGVNAISVPVGNAGALRMALQSVLTHPERFQAIRERAALDARERFKAVDFARRLWVLWESLNLERGNQALPDCEQSPTRIRVQLER
jgi:glycosyltransferase involved in cell wall biosynthesis